MLFLHYPVCTVACHYRALRDAAVIFELQGVAEIRSVNTHPSDFYYCITIDNHEVEKDAEYNVANVGKYVIEIAET